MVRCWNRKLLSGVNWGSLMLFGVGPTTFTTLPVAI